MNDELNPKIIGVYKELSLIGNEIHLKLGDEYNEGASEVYTIDPDPNVTETITCTDCVCSTTTPPEFKNKFNSFQVKFILPKTLCFADDVNISLKKSKVKG